MSYPTYAETKPSGVEWLGDVPQGWDVVPLKFLASFAGGGTPAKENLDFWAGDIPWVSPKDMKSEWIEDSEDHISEEALATSATSMVAPGTVLIVVRSGILKHTIPVAINSVPVSLNQDMKAVMCGKRMEAKYFALLVRGCQNALLTLWRKAGATVESIEHEYLANTECPIPPLPEQQQIAAFLDRKTAELDAVLRLKEHQLELLAEKRQALISQAVTRGLDPTAPLKPSGIPWLGDVPRHWAIAPLYARYGVQLGKMLDTARIKGAHLAPYLRNVDVQWDHVNVSDLPTMDFSQEDREKFRLRPGDLLVCEGGEVGRAALWNETKECYYQKAIHRLRPNSSNQVPRYFYYVLFTASYKGVFVAEGNPNTIDHLPAEKLRQHRFPFPPPNEQQAIVASLDRETARMDGIAQAIRAQIGKVREYRQALLSAAVTGKIDVRGA